MNTWREIRARLSDHLMADTAILMTGTIITQVISFMALPILARSYGAGEYGLYASVLALLSVVNVISCGRYELAILLPNDEEEVDGLLFLTFFVSLCVSLFAFLICFYLNKVGRLSNPLYWYVIVLIPLSAMALILNYWLIRKKDYRTMAAARVVGGIVSTAVQLLCIVLSRPSAFYLLAGYLVGVIFSLYFMVAKFVRLKNRFSTATVRTALRMARRYRRFPLVEAWGAFLDTLGTQFPVFLFQFFTNAEVVGLYAMAVRLLGIPINLIGSSFNSVFHERIASIYRSGKPIWQTVKGNILALAEISFVPYLLLLFGSYSLIPFFLGIEWTKASGIIQSLSLGYWVNLIYSPLSLIFIVRQKQGKALLSHLSVFVFPNLALALLLSLNNLNTETIFLGFGLALVLLYGSLSIWSLSEASRKPAFSYKQIAEIEP